MRVVILCGIPGSGKSTYIIRLEKAPWILGRKIVSADHYFQTPYGYKFNPQDLPEAHNECLRQFNNVIFYGSVVDPTRYSPGFVLVVDNTNTTIPEIAPYAALALAYGHTLEIITLLCDVDLAFKRCIHGVPRKSIEAMAKRLADREFPHWWNHRIVKVS